MHILRETGVAKNNMKAIGLFVFSLFIMLKFNSFLKQCASEVRGIGITLYSRYDFITEYRKKVAI